MDRAEENTQSLRRASELCPHETESLRVKRDIERKKGRKREGGEEDEEDLQEEEQPEEEDEEDKEGS